jgi:type VII secretion protein EssA
MRRASVSNCVEGRHILWCLFKKVKKEKAIRLILGFALSWMFLFVFSSRSLADDNGLLQLDPSIISNSNGGLGAGSDFPIVNELFTDELNQKVQLNMQAGFSEAQEAIDFSDSSVEGLYRANTAEVSKGLFVNYQPQAAVQKDKQSQTQNNIWYILFILAGGLLTLLAVYLGWKNAERKVRKRK